MPGPRSGGAGEGRRGMGSTADRQRAQTSRTSRSNPATSVRTILLSEATHRLSPICTSKREDPMARLTAAQRQTMLDSPWFGALPAAPRDEALDVATLRHLNEGEVVYAKDRPADAWYGIVAGAIRLGASGPDGRQGLLTFLQPGAWFGDTSLFDQPAAPARRDRALRDDAAGGVGRAVRGPARAIPRDVSPLRRAVLPALAPDVPRARGLDGVLARRAPRDAPGAPGQRPRPARRRRRRDQPAPAAGTAGAAAGRHAPAHQPDPARVGAPRARARALRPRGARWPVVREQSDGAAPAVGAARSLPLAH